jgi:hypothetical protein
MSCLPTGSRLVALKIRNNLVCKLFLLFHGAGNKGIPDLCSQVSESCGPPTHEPKARVIDKLINNLANRSRISWRAAKCTEEEAACRVCVHV